MFGHVHDDMSTARDIIPNMKKESFFILETFYFT